MEDMTQGQAPVQPTEAEIETPVTEVPETPASTTEVPAEAEASEQAPAA